MAPILSRYCNNTRNNEICLKLFQVCMQIFVKNINSFQSLNDSYCVWTTVFTKISYCHFDRHFVKRPVGVVSLL